MPGRTVSGLAPCLIHLPEPVPVMPRIVSVKDCCFLQGLLQPEAFQGLAGSGLPHESDGMGADRRLVLDSCARAVSQSPLRQTPVA